MTFVQRRNCLTTHFSECIPVDKRRITVLRISLLISCYMFRQNCHHQEVTPTFVVCFLLGDSPASQFYMPTFRNSLFHLHRRVGSSYLPAFKDGTVCSETSAYKIQTPGNYPEESTQHSEPGESLKSRTPIPLYCS